MKNIDPGTGRCHNVSVELFSVGEFYARVEPFKIQASRFTA